MGRGGRGGGGGGRSGGFSGGGSRSSGSRMSSGGRGGYSGSRVSHSGFSGGSFHTSHHHHYHYGGFHPVRTYRTYRTARVYTPVAAPAWVVRLVLVCLLAVFVLNVVGVMGTGVTASTVEREKLGASYTSNTEFYIDELDWVENRTVLERGLKKFYNETGVHPLLVITDNVDGDVSPSSAELEGYAGSIYDQYVSDEGHIVLVFHEYNSSGNYNMAYVVGSQAKTVMDTEACNILMDYIDHYYYSDYNTSEFFAKSFEEAGERIMEKTVSPFVPFVIIVGAVVILMIAFEWWKKAMVQKNLEAEQTQKILETDINDLAKDPELADLESKYSK